MREILFRAKREDNGEWAYGYYVRLPDAAGSASMIHTPARNPDESNSSHFIRSSTIGQYTGLTDKNGTRIFEGDIVRHYCKLPVPGGEIGTDRGTIKWDSEECFFFRTSLDGKDKTISAKCEYEIIGNIYDNPELIGGGENG